MSRATGVVVAMMMMGLEFFFSLEEKDGRNVTSLVVLVRHQSRAQHRIQSNLA